MTDFVTSPDGTRIAYDRLGVGPPLVLIGGIFCARPTTQELAEGLAGQFTVVNYDRRGRGREHRHADHAAPTSQLTPALTPFLLP